MNAWEWPLWILLGAGTALFFLNTQKWSVQQIAPQKPFLSQVIVLGGTLIRWLLIALLLVLALRRSAVAALVFFATFMIARLVILFVWERNWRSTAVQTNSQKE
jgi:hypothetical protein